MRRHATRARLSATTLVALVLVACGDGSDGPSATASGPRTGGQDTDDIAAALEDELADEGIQLSDEELADAAELLAGGDGTGQVWVDGEEREVGGVDCGEHIDDGFVTFEVDVRSADVDVEIGFRSGVDDDGTSTGLEMDRAGWFTVYDWTADGPTVRYGVIGEEPGFAISYVDGRVTGSDLVKHPDWADDDAIEVRVDLQCP